MKHPSLDPHPARRKKPRFVQRHQLALACLCTAALFTLSLAFTNSANAATVTFDAVNTPNGQIDDGGGLNWDTTTSNWTTDGGTTNTTFTNGDQVFFGGGAAGTAGTVTLTENITTQNVDGGLQFNVPNAGTYTIDLNGNTLTPGGNVFRPVYVNGGTSVTINDTAGTGSYITGVTTQAWSHSITGNLTINAKITDADGLGGGTNGRIFTAGAGNLTLTNAANDFTGYLGKQNGGVLSFSSIADSGVASAAGAGNELVVGFNAQLSYTGTGDSSNRTLTLYGDNGTLRSDGSGALVMTGTINNTMNANQSFILRGSNTGANEIQGVIADSASGTTNLSKEDAGRWILSGNNTYSGTTTINAGTLEISGAGQLGGGTYSSTLSINGGSTFHYDGDNLQVFDGTVQGSGTGGIFATGAGQLRIVFSTANTNFTGPVTVDGGSLQFRNTSDLQVFDASDLNIEGGGALAIQSSVAGANRTVLNNKTWTFDNGGGTLTFNNGNHLFQGGGSTHDFVVTAGGSGSEIRSINGGFMNMQGAGNIVFDVADGAQARDLELSATWNNGLLTKDGAGTLAITGDYNVNAATNVIDINAGTLEVGDSARLANNNGGDFTPAITNDGTFLYNSTANQTLSGDISGTGSLEKDNTGTLTLSGTNTYTGTTTVSAGTILINGDNSSATGNVTVASTATLGGTGTIGGATTVQSGGTLSPGDGGVGTLTFSSDLDISSGVGGATSLHFDLGAAPSGDQVSLLAGDTLSIGSGLLNFDDFMFSDLGVTGGMYTLFDTQQSITGTLGTSLTGFIGGFGASISLSDGGQDIVLTIIPEPSRALLLLVGVLGILSRRRRN